jgi:FKBP-type peptidyl-prolyl cis-trans isomerase FkpA
LLALAFKASKMKYLLLIAALLGYFTNVFAAEKDSTLQYDLPDSITATSFITDVTVTSVNIKKEMSAGIRTSEVSLTLEGDKKEREVEFTFPSTAKIIATGIDIRKEKDELEWKYEWKPNTTYKLLIMTAADSAGNFVLYSGYIFLPEANKWKFIGTCRIEGQWSSIKSPASFYSVEKKPETAPVFANTWIQRSNGSWKKLDETSIVQPVIAPLPNIDSVAQYDHDRSFIEQKMLSSNAVWPTKEGVYYQIENPGTGKSFTAADTITVFYKLRIFGTEEVISGGSDKPNTFPLNRLIKAWQIAVPLIKTGGKIRLVIPSGQGYSIRTRAADIPPNSILDFEIEVLDAKPAK